MNFPGTDRQDGVGVHLHRAAFGAVQVSRPGCAGFDMGGKTPPYSTSFSL
jgi:hypothetical protein